MLLPMCGGGISIVSGDNGRSVVHPICDNAGLPATLRPGSRTIGKFCNTHQCCIQNTPKYRIDTLLLFVVFQWW